MVLAKLETSMQENQNGLFSGSLVAKTLHCQCMGLGSIPNHGTRSHMSQVRVQMPELMILKATVEIKYPMCCN